jgi:predicted site-specific integrase-resolvase
MVKGVKKILSASVIARLEQVNRSTVVKWIRNSFFPGAVKPKGRWKWQVPVEDYQAFQKQQAQQKKP